MYVIELHADSLIFFSVAKNRWAADLENRQRFLVPRNKFGELLIFDWTRFSRFSFLVSRWRCDRAFTPCSTALLHHNTTAQSDRKTI